MVFSSPIFLFAFLPIVYLLYLISPVKLRNGLLLIASLIFYGWGEPIYVFLMILISVANYGLALGMDRAGKQLQKLILRGLFILAVLMNIGTLAVFKYTDFIVRSLNQVLALEINEPGLPLPIGISFFIFQALSYVIDVYRKEIPVQKRLGDLILYISFFPQLIAGPIIKYHDIAHQIHHRTLSFDQTASGLCRFSIGLAKKVLIANTVGQIADQVYGLANQDLTMPVAWIGALAYLFQIYFDFSGYSDMAIGLGMIFGFTFKENFDYPYIADSMQAFWRRWHLSLSTWFKEYLYIPLGGNQISTWRTGLNKVIVFFLTGLWHGANWTFVIWGLVHGLFLLLETYRVIRPDRLWRPIRHLYTLLIVTITFVLFRSESFTQAQAFLVSMFAKPLADSQAAAVLLMQISTTETVLILLVSIIASLPISRWIQSASFYHGTTQLVLDRTRYLFSIILLLLSIFALASNAYNPFIYFRF